MLKNKTKQNKNCPPTGKKSIKARVASPPPLLRLPVLPPVQPLQPQSQEATPVEKGLAIPTNCQPSAMQRAGKLAFLKQPEAGELAIPAPQILMEIAQVGPWE